MKKIISIVLFLGFVLLCGSEIVPKFIASAQKESNAVLYVRSAAEPQAAEDKEITKTDYKKLVESINANGA